MIYSMICKWEMNHYFDTKPQFSINIEYIFLTYCLKVKVLPRPAPHRTTPISVSLTLVHTFAIAVKATMVARSTGSFACFNRTWKVSSLINDTISFLCEGGLSLHQNHSLYKHCPLCQVWHQSCTGVAGCDCSFG